MARKQKKSQVVPKTRAGSFRTVSAWMQVAKVRDGNTIDGTMTVRRWWFWTIEEVVIVRPAGIVCPELHIFQAGREPDDYAIETMQYVKQRVEGKRVKIVVAQRRTGELIRENYTGEFSEPRLLAFIHPTLWGIKRKSLNETLVRKGWARRHSKPDWINKDYNRQLLRAEQEAKRRKAGMWINYEAETEPGKWDFWIGFILGALVGFVTCFLWLTNMR